MTKYSGVKPTLILSQNNFGAFFKSSDFIYDYYLTPSLVRPKSTAWVKTLYESLKRRILIEYGKSHR